MVNKVFKFVLIFILSIIFIGCSLDNKTGIWNTNQKRKNVNTKLINLSDNSDSFQIELNPELTINLNSQAKTNNKWIMSGLNYTNLTNHLKFDSQVKKFSKYKYKKIQHSTIRESPLIVEKNYFIIMGEKGTILKFTNNKKLQWSKNIYSKREKNKIENISLTLHEEKLYAVDNLGKYYVLNVVTGEIVWINQHKAIFNSQIKVYKNKIFVVDGNNVINCFSVTDGKEIWKYETNPTFIKTNKKLSIIVTSDSVLFSNTAGDIAKIDINTGELIWFIPTQNTLIKHETDFLETSDIVLFKENLFFSDNFSKLFSLNINSGIIKWILNINSNIRPIIIDNYLFTISKEGYLIVIDIAEGKIIRSNYILGGFESKQKKKLFIHGFLIASNKAYITTNLGYLIICSIKTGKVEKVSKISKSPLSEPLISNNNLYILTDKSLIVFD